MFKTTTDLISVDDFTAEKKCVYKCEEYLVRNNGAICRLARPGKRKRPNDGVWTFGSLNKQNSYLYLGNVRVHRVVATGFHGEPPNPNYVVDHKDSNRNNNRPENLQWLTRLENTIKNPVTRKKIEYLCGSVENFLNNPRMLDDMNLSPDTSWMRRVTVEEAQACKVRMELFLNSKNAPMQKNKYSKGNFAKRALKPIQKWEADLAGEPGLDFAGTPWCAQIFWDPNMRLPQCPDTIGEDQLQNYYDAIVEGELFAIGDQYNVNFELYAVDKFACSSQSFLVLCISQSGKFAIVGIAENHKNHFIHYFLESFSREEEARAAIKKHSEESSWYSSAYNNQMSWLDQLQMDPIEQCSLGLREAPSLLECFEYFAHGSSIKYLGRELTVQTSGFGIGKKSLSILCNGWSEDEPWVVVKVSAESTEITINHILTSKKFEEAECIHYRLQGIDYIPWDKKPKGIGVLRRQCESFSFISQNLR